MTIKKSNVQIILSEEDLNIFEKAYEILCMIVEEGEIAHDNDVDIDIVDEENYKFRYDEIESARSSLGNILWYR